MKTMDPVDAHGFVGLTETRFPLNLTPTNPQIERIWTLAKGSTWDSKTDIPYHEFDRTQYSAEQLEAAALFWSRRAWSEYTGIAESPVVLLRMALEGFRSPEGKYVLASKLMDEAKHTEASYLLAEAIGGYSSAPPGSVSRRGSVVAGLRDRGLDAKYCFEAVVAGWHCVSETIAVRVFKGRYGKTTDPIVRDVLGRIIKDEARHIDFGWHYLDEVMPTIEDADIRENVRAAMVDVIENIELAGFHSTAAADDPNDPFAGIDHIVAEAGLGAADSAYERGIVNDGLAEIRVRAAKWGIDLPEYALEPT